MAQLYFRYSTMNAGKSTEILKIAHNYEEQNKHALLFTPVKIAQIFTHLKKKGVSAASLKKIHAPVGLPINSHTPEEIAISIVAEIIQVKNQPK